MEGNVKYGLKDSYLRVLFNGGPQCQIPYLLKDLREVEQGLAGLLEQAGHGRLVPHSDLALSHIQRQS